MRRWWLAVCCLALMACGDTGVPEGVTPVTEFDVSRYLGRWYEIARLDHRFERGLTHVTADYSLRDDGSLRVLNRGYDPEKGGWREAEGRALFVEDANVGRLKVSFFGPFYGGYNIIALDRDHYQWSLVSGPTREYLWILARQPQLDPDTYRLLTDKAGTLGFATDELIAVEQRNRPEEFPEES